MKKSMLILILTALLSACVPTESTQETSENPAVQMVVVPSEAEEISESKSYSEPETQPLIEYEISTSEATVTTAKIQSETACSTTTIAEMQKEKSREEPSELQLELTTENTEKITETPTELSVENTAEKTNDPPQTETIQTAENTEVTITEPEEYEETEPPEVQLSDYQKALEIYNFMASSGSGTCVQYAYQTYEMCLEYGLECYFAWTENQLYGHVANVVKIDGVWYVLDTQAGCFLTENMCGFIEIVDENERYIASADIISSVRYE